MTNQSYIDEKGRYMEPPKPDPTPEQIKKMLVALAEDGTRVRDRLEKEGVTGKELYKRMKAEVLPRHPYLSGCIAVYSTLGGVKGYKKGSASFQQTVGVRAIRTIGGLVSWRKYKALKAAEESRRAVSRRGPVSKTFKAYRDVADQFGKVPDDKIAAILMLVTTDKIVDFRRELAAMGYSFLDSRDGWVHVDNARKTEIETLQRQMAELQKKLAELTSG